MICSPRVLLSLAKLACLAIVIIQTSLNIYDEFHTNKTEDDTYTKPLSKIEFPIVFNVIISPSFQAEKFKDFGFRSSLEYFLGMNSLTPPSSGGWAGYSDDGMTSNVSGRKRVKLIFLQFQINPSCFYMRVEGGLEGGGGIGLK